MDQIRPWLFIGKYRETLQLAYLQSKSISAMLQLSESVEQHGIISLYLPVADIAPVSHKHLRQGLDFISEQRQIGNRVLVACGAGINRSAAFSAAAIKEAEGISLFDALKEVKRCHPESMPHEPVWVSLCSYYGEKTSYLEVIRMDFERDN